MRRGVSRDGNAPGDAISAAVVLDEQLHERVEAAGAEPMSGWVGRLALGALTIGAATWIPCGMTMTPAPKFARTAPVLRSNLKIGSTGLMSQLVPPPLNWPEPQRSYAQT